MYFLQSQLGNALTLHSPGQFLGKEDVGQLALRVGCHGKVSLLTVHILKVDLTHWVGRGGHSDHPGRSRVLQEVQQKEGQEEVT